MLHTQFMPTDKAILKIKEECNWGILDKSNPI
jgi:hypothetical protein